MISMKLPHVPFFQIRGSPRAMGRMLGEQAAAQIQSMVAEYQRIIHQVSGFNWAEAVREAQKYLPYAQSTFPEYVEEVAGIAQGAGVRFEDAWLLNCYEGVAQDQKLMACTTIGANDDVTADGHVYLAHNEDWLTSDGRHVYLVHATPDNGPPFLAMSYGPMLPNVGLNAAGLAVGINSVYPKDVQVGVPRVVASRAILAAQRMSDAIRACLPGRRAGGYHYMLADRSGEIFGVESSATHHELLYAEEGWLVHTNHYLTPRMRTLEQPRIFAGSNVRLRRAQRLVRRHRDALTAESLQSILRDHASEPELICKHEEMGKNVYDRSQTILSLVMDLTGLMMWVAPGPPCCGEYLPYWLLAPAARPAGLADVREADGQAGPPAPGPASPKTPAGADPAFLRKAARAVLVDGAVPPSET